MHDVILFPEGAVLLFPTTATPYHDVSLDFILTFIDEQLVIDTFRYNIDIDLGPSSVSNQCEGGSRTILNTADSPFSIHHVSFYSYSNWSWRLVGGLPALASALALASFITISTRR